MEPVQRRVSIPTTVGVNAPKPQYTSGVLSMLEQTSKEVAELTDQIIKLESMLQPVLNPSPAYNAEKELKCSAVCSPATMKVLEINDSIRMLKAKIEQLSLELNIQ
jgi:hypothetical protein